MSEHNLTTADLATRLGYKTAEGVRKHARALNLGIDLGGSAGFRYSEVEYRQLVEYLRPTEAAPKRRRKRRAA